MSDICKDRDPGRPYREGMGEERRGYLYGLIAYALWGFFPIYFKLLQPATPVRDPRAPDPLVGRLRQPAAGRPAQLALPRPAPPRPPPARRRSPWPALLIGVNWATYIVGVNSSRVVETALGLLHHAAGHGAARRDRAAGAAPGLAVDRGRASGALAVAVLTVDYGRLPYIALGAGRQLRLVQPDQEAVVAAAGRGAVRRVGRAGGAGARVPHLAERWPAAPSSVTCRPWHTILMVLSGVATAVPLLLFAASANRVPMVGLGILQYVAPILQLACGRAAVPRADAAGAAGRVRAGLDRADHLHRRRHPRRATARAHGPRRTEGRTQRADAQEAERTAADPTAATAEPAAALPPR